MDVERTNEIITNKRSLACKYNIMSGNHAECYINAEGNEWLCLNTAAINQEIIDITNFDEIGDFALANCDKLIQINIGYDLKRIGHGAFFGCSSLKKIIFKGKEYKIIPAKGIKKEIDSSKGLDVFIKQFESEQGEIGIGAFENCSGQSILVPKENKIEEELHNEFVKKILPESLRKNENEDILIKICEGDGEGHFNISLLNYNMLIYDMRYFNLNKNKDEGEDKGEDKKYYYRPYFYEFTISENCNVLNKVDKSLIGEWMIGRFKEPDETSENETRSNKYALLGDVIFSASPIKFERKKLEILDKSVPVKVKDAIKKTYELSYAKRVNKNNKKSVLYPIVNEIIKNATPKSVNIYKVGQANCNYIYFDNYKRIMFDVGYTYIKENSDNPKISIAQPPSRCRPHLVILSHWDLDHILGVVLCEKTIFDINWIAPDMEKLPNYQYSVSASRLAKYLCWKNILFLIDEDLKGENVFYSESFQIWKGLGDKGNNNDCGNIYNNVTKKLNKANNFGLIITLNNNNNQVLLSGDCEYQMLPCEIYNRNIRYKYMLVPHHGSKMKLICPKLKSSINDDHYAFISYGYNHYGHYDKEHKTFLENMGYNVKTTEESAKGYKICLNLGQVIDL